MTSKYIECSIVIDLCNKRLEEYETGRKQNLEKWIKKYSYYTTGMLFWKQRWERCRQSTIAYLDSNKFKEDSRSEFYGEWLDYMCDCHWRHDDEYEIISILNLAKAGDEDMSIMISPKHYNLISGE